MENPHYRAHGRRGAPVVAITGAGGGLGREVALRFARDGAAVACVDVNPATLAVTTDLLSRAGDAYAADVVDAANEAEVARWRDDLIGRLGHPQVLVNCGGVLDRRSSGEVTLDDFMSVVRINLGGCYATARAFAPGMAAAGAGRIVNIASIAGLTGYPYPAYAASKAGVINLTRSLLGDLWGTGVTVNAVCPGAMVTPMMNHAAAVAMVHQTPSGHLADPREVADTVAFLCGAAGRNINGSTIVIDGGATAFFAYRTGRSDDLA